MNWLARLERKFGWFGVPNLIMYIVAGRGMAYLLALSNPDFPYYLMLNPEAVWHGQVWRLFTYIFMPPATDILFLALFELYVTYLIGNALEAVWGVFRFTLYYAIGALATAVVAVLVTNSPVSAYYLNLSLFLAFATLFPDFTFLVFFILPVKVKYLGWISAGFLTYSFWTHPFAVKVAILTALTNYFLFFWSQIREWMQEKIRAAPAGERRALPPTDRQHEAMHRCVVCRKTERDDRELEFRICTCARCGEGKEFCMAHLQEHRRLNA